MGSFGAVGADGDVTWTAPPAARDPQTITLTLTVTDDGAATRSTSQSVTVTVRANQAPTRPSALRNDLNVKGGETVSLDGMSAADVTAYAWSTDVGTFAGSATTATGAAATWTAPGPSRTGNTGTITLTVTDALGATVFTIPVTVQADLAPTGSVKADPATVFGGNDVQLTDNTQRRRPVVLDPPVDREPRCGQLRQCRQSRRTLGRPRPPPPQTSP